MGHLKIRVYDMNRRGFLKLCGIAVVVPSLPAATGSLFGPRVIEAAKFHFARPSKETRWPEKFDPMKGCSHAVRWAVPGNPGIREEMRVTAKTVLTKNMESYVPPTYRKHVKYGSRIFNWSETEAMSWFYEPPDRRST